MRALATALGYLLLITFWIAVSAWSVAAAAMAVHRLLEVTRQRAARLERVELGNNLRSTSWWFSEDKATMDVLAQCGTALADGLTTMDRVVEIRETWRRHRREAHDLGEVFKHVGQERRP